MPISLGGGITAGGGGGGGGGGGPTSADQVSLANPPFVGLLAGFTGGDVQQGFEFLDGVSLNLNITAFSTSLSGSADDLAVALAEAVTVNYTLEQFARFTQLRLVVNNIEIPVDLPLQEFVVGQAVAISAGLQQSILNADGDRIRSFLRGTLSDSEVIISSTVTLNRTIPTFLLYSGIFTPRNVSAFVFEPASRMEFVNDRLNFSLGPVPETGEFAMFAIPSAVTAVSLLNTGLFNFDELVSYPIIGTATEDSIEYTIRSSNALVENARFDYQLNIVEN